MIGLAAGTAPAARRDIPSLRARPLLVNVHGQAVADLLASFSLGGRIRGRERSCLSGQVLLRWALEFTP